MPHLTALAAIVGVTDACAALGVPRSTYYRWCQPTSPAVEQAPTPRSRSPRALTPTEREQVRTVLLSERFVDLAPRTIYAILLEEGTYLCHWRTMYRILQAEEAVQERRAIRHHTVYTRPELLATAPRQVWSWDITLLRGPHPGIWYRLYVVLDIFSRKVVGWLLADREAATLAEQLIADACMREQISPQQLTLHADRGAAMTSKTVAELLLDLGVAQSHSRPSVSNDNPYSEAQFKTMKYGATYPERFASWEEAEGWVTTFIQWYNTEHRHSGIGFLTPEMLHTGQAETITATRQATLDAAYTAHPERFVGGSPTPPEVPDAAWINPPPRPVSTNGGTASGSTTVPRHGLDRSGTLDAGRSVDYPAGTQVGQTGHAQQNP